FASGRPAPGVRVWVERPGSWKVRELETDARGRVRFRELRPGEWHVRAAGSAKAVAVRVAREKVVLDLVVADRGPFTVRVVDRAGKPIAGARVRVSTGP